jgi:hypothetical protein
VPQVLLPFILIERVGMPPAAFGIGTLMQTVPYFLGSVCLGLVSRRLRSEDPSGRPRLARPCRPAGGVPRAVDRPQLSFDHDAGGVSQLRHRLPDALHDDGNPPALFRISQAPPRHCRALSRMGSGFLGRLAAALVGNPLNAFGTIIPAMTLTAIAGYRWFHQAARQAVTVEAASAGE